MAKTKEKFDVEQFVSSFKRKQFSPVYLFCGEESFLINEVTDALIRYAIEPTMKEFNFDLVHGNEIDVKKIVSLASSYPMMADRRVVIIKDFDRVDQKEQLESYAQNPSATTVLVLIANTPDFRKRPFQLLKKLGFVHEASSLKDYETTAWIESQIKKLKRAIEPAAVQLLYSYVGSSLRELTNEIEKLLVTVEEKATISIKDVERIVGLTRDYSPFELANKVAEKKITKSIEIADRLVSSGENAIGIIAVLTQHFIKLWKLQDGIRNERSESELAQIASTHPFYLTSYLAQSKKYTPQEIENVFDLLAEADLAAKSSGNSKLILTKVITEIISGSTLHSLEEAAVV